MNTQTGHPMQLQYFTQAISDEVEAKKHLARRQMTVHIDEAVSQGVAQAEAEAETQITAAKQSIHKSGSKRKAEAIAQSRRNITTLTEHLTNQLFDEIKTDIIAFIHSHEYKDFLINSIQATLAKSRHPFAFVQLPQFELAGAIQEATGLTPEPGHESDIGGFRLLSADRGKAMDCTFRLQLSRAIETFLTELNSKGIAQWHKE